MLAYSPSAVCAPLLVALGVQYVLRIVWHLQAFSRAAMPEPLDLRWRDAVNGAAEDLPAGPWHGCCVPHCHSFLCNLRLNCEWEENNIDLQFTTHNLWMPTRDPLNKSENSGHWRQAYRSQQVRVWGSDEGQTVGFEWGWYSSLHPPLQRLESPGNCLLRGNVNTAQPPPSHLSTWTSFKQREAYQIESTPIYLFYILG